MRASSTSSSDRRRRRPAQVVALWTLFAALAAAAVLSWPLRTRLVEVEFATSELGRRASAAVDCAGGRPVVALLGTSQTRRSLDARAVEAALYPGPAPRCCVFNMGVDGFHPSAQPYALRRVLEAGPVGGVAMELGHIAQDQYGGAWLVRDFVEDDSVVDAFEGCARGRRLVDTIHRERRAPWSVVPALLRTLNDRRARSPRDHPGGRELIESRGFAPVADRKDADEVVRALDESFANETADLVDQSPQRTFVATAKIVSELCRARGVPFVVFLAPVNRALAPRVAVLRHFEETARRTTIPALRAMSIDVLVPPEEFWGAAVFSDSVHLHADAAGRYTAWFADAIARLGTFK